LPALSTTKPGSVVRPAAGTFQRWAAAWISRARPTAPTWRIGSQSSGVEVLPPADCSPNTLASTGACSMRTADQSTSSSSAISIGIEVLIPCPISGRLAAMVTTPSGAMRTKALNGLAPPRFAFALGPGPAG
jgi:hypothetical protein